MAVALTRTTLATALSASDTLVRFANASGFTAGQLAYTDREAMLLQLQPFPAIPSIWQVLRGQCGTGSVPHAVNNQVYTGSPGSFSWFKPQGATTRDGAIALPFINVASGDLFTVATNGSWQKAGDDGVPLQQSWGSGNTAEYTTAGPIAIQNGNITIISGTARAMTLADPAPADDGIVMTIYGAGGGAHTITTSSLGFNGGGSGQDVATFSASGGYLTILVANGVWRVSTAVGVTFS